MYRQEAYNEKVDVFSFGVILFEVSAPVCKHQEASGSIPVSGQDLLRWVALKMARNRIASLQWPRACREFALFD